MRRHRRTWVYWLAWCALTLAPALHAREIRYYFPNIPDRHIYYTFRTGPGGQTAISVLGVAVTPTSQRYFTDPRYGRIAGYLSPDGERLLLYVGAPDNKNVWVINLVRRKSEFVSHRNGGRVLLPRWIDATTFELVYSGGGPMVTYLYQWQAGGWKRLDRVEDVIQ